MPRIAATSSGERSMHTITLLLLEIPCARSAFAT